MVSSDGTWGALTKSGYRISGMARLDRSQRPVLNNTDQKMRRICCGLTNLCDLYTEIRPPNDCSGYVPPRWSELYLAAVHPQFWRLNNVALTNHQK